MSEDMYTIGVRKFNKTMESNKPIVALLRDRYFPNEIISDDERIRLEVRRRKTEILPAVRRGSNALQIAAAAPHRVDAVEPPYHFYRADVTIDDTKKRVFGEPVDKPYSRGERARVIMAEKLYNGARDILTLQQEAYVSQILKTGKVNPMGMLNDGTLVPFGEIDFQTDSDLVGKDLTGGAGKWTSSSDIVTQIANMAHTLFAKGHRMPAELILGSKAFATLWSNEKVVKQLDNRRIEGSRFEAVPFGEYPGAAVNGYLNIPTVGTIALITYTNEYNYPGESPVKMIDDDYVLLTTPGWGSMGYAALLDSRGGEPDYVAGKTLIHTKQYDIEGGFARAGFIQTAPLPIPTELDSWMYAKVTTA